MFERLRAAVNAALDAAMPPPDWHDLKAQMHRAAVEGRAAVAKMREDVAKTEREIAVEQRHLEDARRRGRLAAEIEDEETVEVAQRFATKHAERFAVLEQKLSAQQAELALADREVEEMVGQLKELERRGGVGELSVSPEAIPDLDGARLGEALDQAAREAAADIQLRELKKRMGK